MADNHSSRRPAGPRWVAELISAATTLVLAATLLVGFSAGAAHAADYALSQGSDFTRQLNPTENSGSIA